MSIIWTLKCLMQKIVHKLVLQKVETQMLDMQFICTSLDLSFHSSKYQTHLQNLGLKIPSFSYGSMQLLKLWVKTKVQESRYFATG